MFNSVSLSWYKSSTGSNKIKKCVYSKTQSGKCYLFMEMDTTKPFIRGTLIKLLTLAASANRGHTSMEGSSSDQTTEETVSHDTAMSHIRCLAGCPLKLWGTSLCDWTICASLDVLYMALEHWGEVAFSPAAVCAAVRVSVSHATSQSQEIRTLWQVKLIRGENLSPSAVLVFQKMRCQNSVVLSNLTLLQWLMKLQSPVSSTGRW